MVGLVCVGQFALMARFEGFSAAAFLGKLSSLGIELDLSSFGAFELLSECSRLIRVTSGLLHRTM